MPDSTIQIIHEVPLDKLPEQWSHWREALSPAAALVYAMLSKDDSANVEVDFNRLIRYFNVSKARFRKAVAELEEHGFLTLDAEDTPPSLTLFPVPEIDPEAPPAPRRTAPITPWRNIWDFLTHWSNLHERYLETSYPRPTPHRRGRDTQLVDEMLRDYPTETLRRLASFFFANREDDEPATVAFFHYRLPLLLSTYRHQGGRAWQKMQEAADA